MLATLRLLAPAVMPSWRFFDGIAPSPRIEYAELLTRDARAQHWQELRPRAQKLPVATLLRRMFWNPEWNETLFLVSCAERLMETETQHSQNEIFRRIRSDSPFLQFRLIFVHREGDELVREVTYLSPIHDQRHGT